MNACFNAINENIEKQFWIMLRNKILLESKVGQRKVDSGIHVQCHAARKCTISMWCDERIWIKTIKWKWSSSEQALVVWQQRWPFIQNRPGCRGIRICPKEIKPLGVGINLLPHSVRVLTHLGIIDRIASKSIATSDLNYYNRFGQLFWNEARVNRPDINGLNILFTEGFTNGTV